MALKILLADDSTTAQNMGKKILTEAGYEVVAVSNGAAAVKKIAEHKPDLVVLDVYMPGYTGLEVCERVKSAIETSKIPVLLTVGKMEHFLPEEGARVKADGVIVKPFEASDLLAAVQKLEQRLNSSRPSQAKVMVTPAEPPVEEPPEYERTMKIKTPVFDEKDASYQSWKSETAEPESVPQAEPASQPAVPLLTLDMPEEDFPAAAAEPHSLNVPTDLRAAPAMGLEHLGSELPHEGGPTTSDLMETSPAYLEGSAAESNPYQITEESEGDTPKSSVGRFFTKAKSWFGGASALEDYDAASAGTAAADEGEAETITLSPGEVHETAIRAQHAESHLDESLQTLVPASAAEKLPPPAVFHERTAALAGPTYSHTEPEAESHEAISGLHVGSGVGSSSSWESASQAAGVVSAPEQETMEPDSEVASAPEPASISSAVSDLEVTSPHEAPAGASSDSMLVTDVSEMSAQFPTRFGVKDAEPVPVGNAADYPELYGHATAGATEEAAASSDTQEIEAPELIDAAEAAEAAEPGVSEHVAEFDTGVAAEVAAAMGSSWSYGEESHGEESHVEEEPMAAHGEAESEPSHSHEARESAVGWSAEETHLEENEIGVSLHDEMHQHLSQPPAEPEPEPAAATAESATPENKPDDQLVAAMAAAMGTEITPAMTEAVHQAFTGESTMALDKNTAVIAEIVHRVTERMKPELVAEIARELASEIKKEKQKG